MKKITWIYPILYSLFFILYSFAPSAHAAVCGDNVPSDEGELKSYVEDCNAKLQELSGQKATLAQALGVLNTQINLTQAKIIEQTTQLAKLQVEIADLSGKIQSLDYTLTDLTKLFVARVKSSYIYSSTSPIPLLLHFSGLTQLTKGLQYVEAVRDHDQKLLLSLEKSRLDYDQQKTIKEKKQAEIEAVKKNLDKEKAALATQVAAKNNLLSETKNSESKYQALLSQALAELEAINDIIAGKGSETEVGKVTAGTRIANVIQGASCNSSAAHLHFIVSINGVAQNPFNYLSGADHTNCSGSSCGSGDGDIFNPSGNWSWPISPKVKFTQGYGSTWAVKNTWVGRIYNFHNGIDINSDSSEVRAVATGTLYRGSYSGQNSCNLRYVRVDHQDSDIDTFYLHINY
jgi:peptidoglycan hydrolase CwlO-like protein